MFKNFSLRLRFDIVKDLEILNIIWTVTILTHWDQSLLSITYYLYNWSGNNH